MRIHTLRQPRHLSRAGLPFTSSPSVRPACTRPAAAAPPSAGRPPRVCAGLLVAVCALAYAASLAHLVLVRHAVCLEHGGLVHAAPAAHAADHVPADERWAAPAAPFPDSHGADEHCRHPLVRREAAGPAAPTAALHPADRDGGLRPLAQARLPDPIARLFLAPKASPPGA